MSTVKEIDSMSSSAIPTEPTETTPESTQKPVPRWAIHRRLYDWVLSLAHSKFSSPALFGLSFAESSVFPIPPDVLQISLTLERRERAFYYAFITLLGSVLGAMLGYYIGYALWNNTPGVSAFFLNHVFSEKLFNDVKLRYQEHGFWIVFTAAFTPIPFKVFTITAGVAKINFMSFVLASIVGRAARFFLVGGLLYWFGPPMKRFIDKYFNLLTLAFTVLLIGGFILIKQVFAH